jgi:sugar lactone lactonase YvrE
MSTINRKLTLFTQFSKWFLISSSITLSIESSSQIITTVAGNGTRGAVVDGIAAINSSIWAPMDVTVDSAGNLYIADTYHNKIRKVTASTGIISSFAGNGISGFSGDGGPATNAAIKRPFGVLLNPQNNIVISDGNHRLRRVSSNNIIQTIAGYLQGCAYNGDGMAATASRLCGPNNNCYDGAGNLYIADAGNNRIRKVNASNGVINTIVGNGNPSSTGDGGLATSASINNPTAVCIDGNNNMYIAEQSGNRIRKVNMVTGIISTICGNGQASFTGDNSLATAATLNGPTDICVDYGGNLFIADQLNGRIRRIDAVSGIIKTVVGNGSGTFSGDGGLAINAGMVMPSGLCLDINGNLFVADNGCDRIRKISNINNIPPHIPAAGLIAWHPFNGNDKDESTNNNNPLFNNATLSIDRFGNAYSAYSFNGAQHISGNSNRFPTTSRTISLWYKSENLGSNAIGKNLFGYGGGSCGTSWINIFESPDYSSVGTLETQGHCRNFRSFVSYPSPINNSWHSLVITYNGSTMSYYFDGSLVQSFNQAITTTSTNGKNFFIGTVPMSDGINPLFIYNYEGFKGVLDEVIIWNRALTAQEVVNYYQISSQQNLITKQLHLERINSEYLKNSISYSLPCH